EGDGHKRQSHLRHPCPRLKSAIVRPTRRRSPMAAEPTPGAFMADNPANSQQRYLRTTEAARFLGLSGRTLEKHRTYGTGPSYRKLGGRVVYALEDLKAWADRGSKTSTSDPGVGTVLPAKRQPPLPYAGKERR